MKHPGSSISLTENLGNYFAGALNPGYMMPWNRNPELEGFGTAQHERFWETKSLTPAGAIATKFTWKVNDLASPEDVRAVHNRALCHLLIGIADDWQIRQLLAALGRAWAEVPGSSYDELEDSPMSPVSAQVLSSIVASQGRPSLSLWSENDAQEP